jgi:phthiodiolone/phenolphthiodiolone dimycocerosates ketoreductase
MTITDEDRTFIADHTDVAFVGGVGMEIHRTGGFENALTGIQLMEKLGYPLVAFSEQTQSWIFRSAWGADVTAAAREVPDYEAYYDTVTLMAAGAAVTERVGLASMIDCYRRPPVVVAQSLLTLDHLSKGRVSLMLGTGENKQFEPYGLERTLPRYKRLEEAIRVIKALLTARDPISMDGEFWPLRDALLALEPYNPDRPPAVALLGGGPTAMKIAGRVADGLGTYTPGGYDDDVAGFEEDLATLREEAARNDRDPAAIPVFPANTMVLCENDTQIDAALASIFTRAFVLNLTPTGAHWKNWGGEHPLGDDWALSLTHRSTKFTRREMRDICAKITEDDIQHMCYVGTPEDVAARSAKWFRAAGFPGVPVPMTGANFGTTLFPEQRELADDGLPRWHHLMVRYSEELNRQLAAG